MRLYTLLKNWQKQLQMKRKIELIFVFSLLQIFSYSQILDSLSVLEKNLITLNTEELTAELEQFKSNKRDKLLYLVPNLSYDFVSSRYYLTYNTSQIVGFIKADKTDKRRVISLEQKYILKQERELLKLRRNYEYCNMLFDRLAYEIEIFSSYLQIHEIRIKEHEKNEITVEDFLRSEIATKEKKKNLDGLKDRIMLLIIELEAMTNSEIKYLMPEY